MKYGENNLKPRFYHIFGVFIWSKKLKYIRNLLQNVPDPYEILKMNRTLK